MNRFEKRQEKRRRVHLASLNSNQIAEVDEYGKVVITTFAGYIKKFEPTYYQKSPTFADSNRVRAGSEQEKNEVDYIVRNGQPRFEDKEAGVCLF